MPLEIVVASVVRYLAAPAGKMILGVFTTTLLRNVGLVGGNSSKLQASVSGLQDYLEAMTQAEFSAGWRALRDARDATSETNRNASLQRAITHFGGVADMFTRGGHTGGQKNSELHALTCLGMAAAWKSLYADELFTRYVAEAVVASPGIASDFLADGDRGKINQILDAVGIVEPPTERSVTPPGRRVAPPPQPEPWDPNSGDDLMTALPPWSRPFVFVIGAATMLTFWWGLWHYLLQPFLASQHWLGQ